MGPSGLLRGLGPGVVTPSTPHPSTVLTYTIQVYQRVIDTYVRTQCSQNKIPVHATLVTQTAICVGTNSSLQLVNFIKDLIKLNNNRKIMQISYLLTGHNINTIIKTTNVVHSVF